MKVSSLLFACGIAAFVLAGCTDTSGGVAPMQSGNRPMTSDRAAEMAKPDPSLTPEQNQAKRAMAQDQLKRDQYYSEKYGKGPGKP